ncbi:MAG TPA: hypothetical protein VHB45_00585 [Alloacidobacterium sp.]|nr:hypothetical protein [Alloacidobacterium sp.]
MRFTRLTIMVVLLGCFAADIPLHARQAEEKCDGSTVDEQGAQTAKKARAFLADLQAAMRHDDRKKIADMVSFPVNVIYEGKRVRIRNRQTFLARYDRIFTAHLRKAILDQSAHCLFGNANGEMIGNGEVWFSELGDGSVKIITLNPSVGS